MWVSIRVPITRPRSPVQSKWISVSQIGFRTEAHFQHPALRYEQLVNWITKQLAYWNPDNEQPWHNSVHADGVKVLQPTDGGTACRMAFKNDLTSRNYAELITRSDAKTDANVKALPRAIMWNVTRTIMITHTYRQWVCENTWRNTPLKMAPSIHYSWHQT